MDILHKWYTQVAPFSISARYSCSAWSNQSSFTLKSLYSNIFHENHDKHKFGEEQWTYSTSLSENNGHIPRKWYTQVAPFSISARYSCSAWSNQSSFTLKSLYSNIFHENHDKHKFGEEQWTYSTSGRLKQLLFRFPLDIFVQHGRISLVSHSKVFIRIYLMRTMINTSLSENNGHIPLV